MLGVSRQHPKGDSLLSIVLTNRECLGVGEIPRSDVIEDGTHRESKGGKGDWVNKQEQKI